MDNTQQTIIATMQRWVDDFIVALNICPFAQREVRNQSIRYAIHDSGDDDALYDALNHELQLLNEDNTIETTILVLPQLDCDFDGLINAAGFAQQIIGLLGLQGVYQIANFHPDYVFADSHSDDPANYTNRAPHAALHILRESSVARAVQAHKQAELIPQQNIDRLRDLGLADMQQRFKQLKEASE